MKHLIIAVSLAVCTIATFSFALAQDSAHFDISSADLATLENTITRSHVAFAIVSEANMPKNDPIFRSGSAPCAGAAPLKTSYWTIGSSKIKTRLSEPADSRT